MTDVRKYLVRQLMNGGYVLAWKRPSGIKSYRLYDQKGNPIRNLRAATVDKLNNHIKLNHLFKKDKIGRMTFNLNTVRSMHGKSVINNFYKSKNKNVQSK